MARNRNKKSYTDKTKGKDEMRPDKSKPITDGKSSSIKEDDAKEQSDSKSNGKYSNDPDWYNVFPQLLADAARLTFAEPLGGRMNLISNEIQLNDTVDGWTWTGNNYSDAAVPGICTLTVKPSVGRASAKESPINVAATTLYTNVRYVNSGRKNYDAPDLMLYNLSIADLYSYVMWMQKIFAAAYTYSQRNYYIGRDVLSALGVDANDVIGNLANFRYRLNAFISKVAAYAVPATVNLFKRKAFMYSGLYIETDDTVKSQLYQFRPASFFKFALDSEGLGMLTNMVVDYSHGPLTAEQLFNIGDQLLDNMWADEDFGLMSGDIIKAFGDNIIKLSPVPDAPVLVPTKDEFVLSQFMNADIVPVFVADGTSSYTGNNWFKDSESSVQMVYGCVYQNHKGNLISREAYTQSMNDEFGWNTITKGPGLQLMHVYNSAPDVGDVVEATRLMCTFDRFEQNDEDEAMAVFISGTEIVTAVTYTRRWPDEDTSTSKSWNSNVIIRLDGGTFNDSQLVLLEMLNQFKFAPMLYSVHQANVSASIKGARRMIPMTPLANYTRITKPVLDRLNEVAVLSLLYVPGVAMMQ